MKRASMGWKSSNWTFVKSMPWRVTKRSDTLASGVERLACIAAAQMGNTDSRGVGKGWRVVIL